MNQGGTITDRNGPFFDLQTKTIFLSGILKTDPVISLAKGGEAIMTAFIFTAPPYIRYKN